MLQQGPRAGKLCCPTFDVDRDTTFTRRQYVVWQLPRPWVRNDPNPMHRLHTPILHAHESNHVVNM